MKETANKHKETRLKQNPAKLDKQRARMRVPGWIIGVGAGVICLGMGVFHEQFADIYQKAVLICLECIGIG